MSTRPFFHGAIQVILRRTQLGTDRKANADRLTDRLADRQRTAARFLRPKSRPMDCLRPKTRGCSGRWLRLHASNRDGLDTCVHPCPPPPQRGHANCAYFGDAQYVQASSATAQTHRGPTLAASLRHWTRRHELVGMPRRWFVRTALGDAFFAPNDGGVCVCGSREMNGFIRLLSIPL